MLQHTDSSFKGIKCIWQIILFFETFLKNGYDDNKMTHYELLTNGLVVRGSGLKN